MKEMIELEPSVKSFDCVNSEDDQALLQGAIDQAVKGDILDIAGESLVIKSGPLILFAWEQCRFKNAVVQVDGARKVLLQNLSDRGLFRFTVRFW